MSAHQSMLSGAPWLLAHKSMLAVNQPVKVALYGKDYVLWKDETDTVHALSNACPHMGAMLSEGWCEAQPDATSQVVCPFHALAFDAAGCTVLPGTDKKTLSQLEPLELIIQGDFVWSYGGVAPQIPVPKVLTQIAAEYDFIGETGDTSVAAPLRSMLLNMHDYNHQNGTHREMFRIKEVQFEKFVDEGYHSDAYLKMPKAKPTRQEVMSNPSVLMMPEVIEAHLENYFPSIVLFRGESMAGPIVQCHLFVPESANRTRTYVLVYAKLKSPVFKLMKQSILNLVGTVIEQDADILSKLYADSPQKIKLNNETGMDWVKRNFESWPQVFAPSLSR